MEAKLVSLQCCGEVYSHGFMLDCYGADVVFVVNISLHQR